MVQATQFKRIVYDLALSLIILGFVTVVSAVVADNARPIPEKLQASYSSRALVPALYTWGLAGAVWVVDILFVLLRRSEKLSQRNDKAEN